MKFVNMNKIIAIVIIMMLSFNMYVSFETNKSLHTRRNKSSRRQDTRLMPKINNKWGLLASGFVIGAINTDLQFFKCYDSTKNLVTEVTMPEKALRTNPEDLFHQVLGYFRTFLDMINSTLKAIVPVICTAISFKGLYDYLLNPEQKGRFFIEGRIQKRGIRDFFKTNKHILSMKAKLKNAAHHVHLENILEHLANLKQKVVDLFNHPKVQYIVSFLKCLIGTVQVGTNIYKVIAGMIAKITWIVGAAAGTFGIALAPVIAKVAYGLFCNYNTFRNAYELIKGAVNTADINQKFYFSGMAAGLIFNGFATAKRR